MNTPKSSKKIAAYDERMPVYRFDPTIGWWGAPNIDKLVAFEGPNGPLVRVRHNSDGNRENPFQPDLNVRNIVCFGGSHTWGAFVDQESRYTDRLTAMTKRRFLNLGHGSFGLDQICISLLTKVERYSPSAIIIEQYPWALHRVLNNYINLGPGYLRPFFYLDSDGSLKLQKLSFFTRFVMFRKIVGAYRSYKKELQEFMNGIDLKKEYDPYTDPIFLCWKTQYYTYMYSLIDKILEVIKNHCDKMGYKLLFVVVAYKQQFAPASDCGLIDYNLPAKKFKALLDKNGIRYVDTVPALLSAHTPEDPVIVQDGHTSAKGHKVIAKEINKEMDKLGWI